MKNSDSFSGGPPIGRGKGCGPRGERLERGVLRLLLLDSLREEPKHGYEIMKALETRARGQYSPSAGTIYPTLQLLEDEGAVRVNTEGDRRVFRLTEVGLAEVELNREKIAAFWGRFEAPPVPEPARREVGFLSDELEAFSRTIWGGLREEIERGDREAVRRIRLVLQRCHEEIRDALAHDDTAFEALVRD